MPCDSWDPISHRTHSNNNNNNNMKERGRAESSDSSPTGLEAMSMRHIHPPSDLAHEYRHIDLLYLARALLTLPSSRDRHNGRFRFSSSILLHPPPLYPTHTSLSQKVGEHSQAHPLMP